MTQLLEERILILAPIGQDATAMARLLHGHGFLATICEAASEACNYIKSAAGAFLITEEALELPQIPALLEELAGQPPWGELPVIVLTRGGESRLARLLNLVTQAAGSLTLLERPIGEATLVRSVEVALRSRRRQYQVRDLLQQQRLVQAQLQRSEERLRLAMAGANMGAWDVDLETGVVVWDARQQELYGTVQHGPPRNIEEFYALIHPEDRDRIKQAAAHSQLTGHFADEFRIIRDDGTVRWVAAHGMTVSDPTGRPMRMVGINYDITERKVSQRRLEEFNEELERQVAERTHELMASRNQLRALTTELNLTEQRERKRLAGELHDHLAQMLVLVRLKLAQAKRGPVSSSLESIREAEDVISQSLAYTRNLVAELSPPVLHEFGLPAALRWLGEQMYRYQLAVTVRIQCAEDLRLAEDQAVLLFQSVRELLINSAKHAVSKHAIVIMEEHEGALRIRVEDQGIGFNPLAVTTQKSSLISSQFGLFSIRERMNALGGRFELHSAPGEGTRATLILPLLPSLQKNVACGAGMRRDLIRAQDQGSPSTGRCRIIIADDHAMVRQGLRSVLERFTDIEIIGEASNGHEAVEMTEQHQPSAVVMDVNMPMMGGIEATAAIKGRQPDVVVIGLSVNATIENQEAMRRAGASVLLTKEAAVEELHEAICGFVKQTGKLGIGL
jgi:PAS domain S-box-containing protein